MRIFISLILCLFTFVVINAQELYKPKEGEEVVLLFLDGRKIKGVYKSMNEETLMLDLGMAGVIEVSKENIVSITAFSDATDLEDSSTSKEISNPLYSKYYITETGLGLKKGESYYQNILLAGHILSHGVTDNFSVAMGIETISIFFGSTPGMYVNAKINTSFSGPINVAGGSILGLSPEGTDKFGTFYGVVTIGDSENNISGGVSYLYDTESSESILYQFGFMTKLTNRLSFVLDSGKVPKEDFIFSPTLRWKSKIVALDFGVATDFKSGGVPVAAAAIKF